MSSPVTEILQINEEHKIKHKHNMYGRPQGSYSKVTPKIRRRIVAEYLGNVPISAIARKAKISRPYCYVILREEGVFVPHKNQLKIAGLN